MAHRIRLDAAMKTRTFWKPILALAALAALSACLAGKTAPAGEASGEAAALSAEVIEVQPLEATPSNAAAAPSDAEPEASAPEAAPDEALQPLTDAAADADHSSAQQADVAQPAAPPASPEEAACVRKKGMWVKAGKSGLMACVKITRDSGKMCRSGKDCSGECLARSLTCAPYSPLFGCNEIVQDDGVRTTLCLD